MLASRVLLAAAWAAASALAQGDGEYLEIKYVEGDYFRARCVPGAPGGRSEGPGASVEHSKAPPRPMQFRNVSVEGCEIPASEPDRSWRRWLARLNASAAAAGRLALRLPARALLGADALGGLDALADLSITADSALSAPAELLSPLRSLRSLSLSLVAGARLPPRLDALRLRATGLRALPPAALAAIALEVSEPELVLTSPLQGCERLRELTLRDVTSEELPPGLVSACCWLESLELVGLRARRLPRGWLAGPSLRRLRIADARLPALPGDLLQRTQRLERLELEGIQLESLPSELFSGLEGTLRHVSLAHNALRARDVRALGSLRGLRALSLRDNPLGDLCADHDVSPLSPLTRLESLVLSRANLTRVCADWLTSLRELRALDLTDNRVRALACDQLRVRRTARSTLRLEGNPLEAVRCAREDYERDDDDSAGEAVTISMDSRLRCDCEAYWLARVLRDRGAALLDPRCEAASTSAGVIARDTPLRRAPLSALSCALGGGRCAARCSCELAPHAGGVRARCLGPALPVQDLDKMALKEGQKLVELRATGANVTILPADLPLSLKYLDLENNSITRGSSDAAAELFAGGRRVRLLLNPLRCDCSNRPLLDVLRAHRHLVESYDNMTCVDGRALEPVTDALVCDGHEPGAARGALAAVAGGAFVIIVVVVSLAALLSRRETRLRVKALLHARGLRARWLARRLAPADADRAYDAFVAHAEGDAQFVAEEIVPRLEPTRRLCISYREWPAGAWLPAAIDASVRGARRTLAVLSPRALADGWARAQLRAAHAHALHDASPRLILLLLEVTPAELRSDPELRAALDAHTHVRWGERCFWEKLEYALPEPRVYSEPVKPLPL